MHQVLYLHGFASGPSSTKARFFAARLQALGLTVHVPNLNGKSFSEMTLTSQLQICRNIISQHQSTNFLVIGSSMGGLLATLLSAEILRITQLVLLAPGFGLSRRWHELLGAQQFEQWRETGVVDVFHHAEGQNLPLNFDFITDAESYLTDGLKVTVPTLVAHGINDEVVPISESDSFFEQNRSLVELHRISSDHALTDCLDELWSLTEDFIQRHEIRPK